MACSKCKQKQNESSSIVESSETIEKKGKNGNSFPIRIMVFIISLVIIPFAIPLMILALFNHLVLQREIDLAGAIKKLAKKKKPKNNPKVEDEESSEVKE